MRSSYFVLAVIFWQTAPFSFQPFVHLPKLSLPMLSCPLTPQEISALVQERDDLRAEMKYEEADEIKRRLEGMNIVIKDISYKCEGTSTWAFKDYVEQRVETDLMELAHGCYEAMLSISYDEADICERAKSILRLQLYKGDKREAETMMTGGVESETAPAAIPTRLVSREMQGRKYADAAFEFSLAGITDQELFDLLANYCAAELRRFGQRKSCGSLQIVQMVEKLRVAGIQEHPAYTIAEELLGAKNAKMSATQDLFSGRALLWLWRHATKQTKPTKVSSSGNVKSDITNHEQQRQAIVPFPIASPESMFVDPTLPLILDLGCGYGVSLLSLSEQSMRGSLPHLCNFLGVDLSNRAVRYASGISKRWGQDGRAAFVYADCGAALQWVREPYPGPVALVMVNFPTPYGIGAVLNEAGTGCAATAQDQESSAKNEHVEASARGSSEPVASAVEEPRLAGNTQLPRGFDNFMFSPEIAALVRDVLARSSWSSPLLLLQSNVEDVVVTMSNIVKAGEEEQGAIVQQQEEGGGLIVPSLVALRQALIQLFGAPAHSTRAADGDNAGTDSAAVCWRTYDQLVRSTDPSVGGGRMSQRLQTWLDDLSATATAIVEGQANTIVSTGVRGRTRACGPGWLHCNPLPDNARTETEVHCEVEKQPVHRTVFMYNRF